MTENVPMDDRSALHARVRPSEGAGAPRFRGQGAYRAAWLAIFTVSQAMTGCARAPAFSVLGSFFPAWLVCLLVGIALTFLLHLLLKRLDLASQLSPPVLVYPSLAALFTMALWLVLYS